MNNEYLDNEYTKIDLISLIHGVVKSALRMLIPGILMVLLSVAVMGFRTWRSYTPMYQASASFTVHMKNPFYATQQYYNNSMAEQMAKTFPQVLTSSLLGDKVKKQLGIGYLPSVTATAIGDTNIFTLTVTAVEPQLAYDVLNSVIENYPEVAEFVVGSTELYILDQSGIPTQPYNKPAYARNILLGAGMGVAMWACLAFLFWATHRTVNNDEELANLVNLPCIGHLPKVRLTKDVTCPVVNNNNDKFGFNESMRLLRIRMERALSKIDGKILLVTSTLPNEGKTTVSVNIATALAQKGKKVLLVDCDLRNPSVAGVFGLETSYGFSEYLKGECELKKAYYQTETENLRVVVGGKPVDNPGSLFSNRNAQLFVTAAKETFDYVILDTPPCAMLSDAVEIGNWADANLITVRQDFAVRNQIVEAVRILGDNKKPIIGTVMNMTTPQIGKGNYYGYGYGYGYGHYTKDDD